MCQFNYPDHYLTVTYANINDVINGGDETGKEAIYCFRPSLESRKYKNKEFHGWAIKKKQTWRTKTNLFLEIKGQLESKK